MGADKLSPIALRSDAAARTPTAEWEFALPRDDPRHGTWNGYGNLGCRCDACREAATAYARERGYGGYAKDTCACGKPKLVNSRMCSDCAVVAHEPPHGTEGRYTSSRWRCRCDACRAAASAAKRARREASRVPCSHGCGRLVDGINRSQPNKPPECKDCARERLRAEGRLGVNTRFRSAIDQKRKVAA